MNLPEAVKEVFTKIRSSLSAIIKIVLFLSIVYSAYLNLWHILFANIFLFVLMFIPQIIKVNYKVEIPIEFEFIFLAFVIATFFLGSIRGLVLQAFFGMAIGFMGFFIMLILYSGKKIKKSTFLIVAFAFSLSVAIGLLAELSKFYLQIFLGHPFTGDEHMYVMRSLTLTALGATIAALIGYFYIEDEDGIIKKLIYSFIRKNPKLFKRQSSPEETLEMIKKGESESCEFKSTLRMSLHSNQVDKRVEQMCLKTITALMNSDGGTLLIGVGDNGEISGIEKDGFENSDKFALHFSNLINQHIGKEFIRLLDFESITIEDKNVFRVECLKSDKPVFIKASDGEKFFIRSGPSSIEIAGRELVEYIGRRFGKI